MIALAAGLLVSAFLVAILGVLGWSVYKVSEVRRDKASIDDLNRVIDHLNSLSHGVHASHLRAEKRIDKTEGTLRSAGETDTTIQSRLDALAKQLGDVAKTADAAKATGGTLGATVDKLGSDSTALRTDLGTASASIGTVKTQLQGTDKALAETNDSLKTVRSLSDAFPSTYARWDAFAEKDLSAKSITVAGEMSANRYGLKGGGGSVVGHIRTNNDGSAMQFLRGDTPLTELSGSGIKWGSSELKVAPGSSGSGQALQYCQNNVCFPVSLDRGPLVTATQPPAFFPANSVPQPTGPALLALVKSRAFMATDEFKTGSGEAATPYAGLQNLPGFLVGVPMTKGINNRAFPVSFDGGGIHAYGFRDSRWSSDEPGVKVVLANDARYDATGGDRIDTVVYKFFTDPQFTINTRSYIWFFTRTPESEGTAALNSRSVPVAPVAPVTQVAPRPPVAPVTQVTQAPQVAPVAPVPQVTQVTPAPQVTQVTQVTPVAPVAQVSPLAQVPPVTPLVTLVRTHFKVYQGGSERDMTLNGDGTYFYDTGFTEDNMRVEFKLPTRYQFLAQLSFNPRTPNSRGELGVSEINPEKSLTRREGDLNQSISYGYQGVGDKEYLCFAGGREGTQRIRITFRLTP